MANRIVKQSLPDSYVLYVHTLSVEMLSIQFFYRICDCERHSHESLNYVSLNQIERDVSSKFLY